MQSLGPTLQLVFIPNENCPQRASDFYVTFLLECVLALIPFTGCYLFFDLR